LTTRAQFCYNYLMKLFNVTLSSCKKKNSFPFLLLLWIIFPVLFMPADIFPGDDSTIKRGEIFAGNKLFKYEKNYDFINIYDTGNNLVFSAACEEKNTVIKSFGYSKTYNSFFVFKEKFNPDPINFELSMEFENFNIPVINRSATAFYTPVLVENSESYVIYISEDSSIVIYDLEKKLPLQKIKSKTPIMKLFKNKIGDREILGFHKFVDRKYKKFFFYIEDIGTGKINFFDFKDDKKEESDYKGPGEEGPFMPTPYKPMISLDYKKIIAFGDSITYGVINREAFPGLGYIPRLQSLVNQQLYDEAEVINEGIPGLTTDEGVRRIEPVILLHNGKYLLFHLGTNDVIQFDLPTSTVIANIEYMINIVLKYNMQPIITTLIPRHGGKREDLKRYRGKIISEGIAGLSESLNLPLIDLWDIFLNYPANDGGYMSLMSDNVHPSEKGYQLMAGEWLQALLGLPPLAPTGVAVLNRSRNQITVQWLENPELDVVRYLIKFGYSPSTLNRTVTTSTAYYVFIYNPLFSPFNREIYFQVQAVDSGGNSSEFTPVQEIAFNETGISFPPSLPIIFRLY
jgi:lysophospholipase L1-like esterase